MLLKHHFLGTISVLHTPLKMLVVLFFFLNLPVLDQFIYRLYRIIVKLSMLSLSSGALAAPFITWYFMASSLYFLMYFTNVLYRCLMKHIHENCDILSLYSSIDLQSTRPFSILFLKPFLINSFFLFPGMFLGVIHI